MMMLAQFRIGAAVAAVVLSASAALAQDKVAYGTASRVGLANAAMFMAEVMGFFREENIELQTVQFDGTGVLLPQIANKSITVGYPIPDPLILSHDTGKSPLPIKFFYNVNHSYNWEIVVPAASPIKSIPDLKGKTIGVIALSVGNVPVTRSILREAGLKPGDDVQLVAVGQGPATINTFTSGRIDALNLFDVVHSQMEADGIAIRRVPLPEKYRQLSGNSFAAHVDTFRENPDLLKRFGRAYTKGLVACDANPEGCVRAMWKLHPSSRPTSGDEAKIIADSVRILQANMRNKVPEAGSGAPAYGRFDERNWKTSLEILGDNGMLQNRDIDLSKLYTNEFVPAFGEFDRAAVLARAKAFK
jgi:NitT/TauT family transport system substrate-binding protein